MVSALLGHEVDMSDMTERMQGNHETLKANNNIQCAREVDVVDDCLVVHRVTLDGPLSY